METYGHVKVGTAGPGRKVSLFESFEASSRTAVDLVPVDRGEFEVKQNLKSSSVEEKPGEESWILMTRKPNNLFTNHIFSFLIEPINSLIQCV
jgi:hypothetical protein